MQSCVDACRRCAESYEKMAARRAAHSPSCCPDKDGYPVAASDIFFSIMVTNPGGGVDEINS